MKTCVARSSSALALNMQGKQVLVFYKEGFQLLEPSKFWDMIENANMFSLKSIQHMLNWFQET